MDYRLTGTFNRLVEATVRQDQILQMERKRFEAFLDTLSKEERERALALREKTLAGEAQPGATDPDKDSGGPAIPKKPTIKRDEVSEDDYRAAWCQYKYECDRAGIRFTHDDLGNAIGLQEGSARNYYNDKWKPDHTSS